MKQFTFYIVIIIILFTTYLGFSQNIGINTTGATPADCALLEIGKGVDATPDTKGLLIPRVNLTATDVYPGTMGTALSSLLVYNLATSGVAPTNVSPGYYYWSGTEWLRISTGTAWLTTGNSETIDGTNFLGTTDDIPFNIKVNNQKSGIISNNTTNGETFFGYQAGNLNTTGEGLGNTAMGNQAFAVNTTGDFNTAIGYASLSDCTIGSQNTAIGKDALTAITSGSANTGIGYNAMLATTIGSGITAVGAQCLPNVTGSTNTGIGYFAMTNLTTGTQNTGIGSSAGPSAAGATNTTAIGYSAAVNADNKVRIGNVSVLVIEGQVNWSFPSDGRFKTNVKEDVPGLAFINKLRPVTYNFQTQKFDEFLHKNDPNFKANSIDYIEGTQKTQSGFIAQEIERAMIETSYDFSGLNIPTNENDNYSVGYACFVVPLVKAVQELSSQNTTLQEQNNLLLEQTKTLFAEIELLKQKQNKTDRILAAQAEEILIPLVKSLNVLNQTNFTLLAEIELLKQLGAKNANYFSEIEILKHRADKLEEKNSASN